jgi:hypothetical protein
MPVGSDQAQKVSESFEQEDAEFAEPWTALSQAVQPPEVYCFPMGTSK